MKLQLCSSTLKPCAILCGSVESGIASSKKGDDYRPFKYTLMRFKNTINED